MLEEKTVAYFVALHLDTVCEFEPHPVRTGERVYKVDGKPRPMLVLQRRPEKRRGRRWFFVLPITSKGLNEKGELLPGMERIGNCLDPTRDSFVELRLRELPENMIHLSNGSPVVKTACDPLAFANALKVLQHRLMSRAIRE